MDSERKSGMSSYYGGQGNGDDTPREHYDSGSSYYNNAEQTSRQSTELLSGKKSAGYNRKSFFDAGRVEPLKGGFDDEEQQQQHEQAKGDNQWDVFADFNNAGPRYSTAFGQQETAYQPISHGTSKHDDGASSIGPVEMITVPALGPEWKASEMRDMTKSAKRQKNNERTQQKIKEWRRGERGMCGKYFTRRFTVFFLFGLIIAVGIILAITIPRVPGFAFNQITPLALAKGEWNASIPIQFSRAPANFSFPALADLQVDTNSNILPLKFTHLNAQIFDLDSDNQVATGDLYSYTVPAKAYTTIEIPLNFSYVATNDSDTTWVNWYDACRNSQASPSGTRPGVRFRLVLYMKIAGLIGSHATSAQLTNANCPIELPTNAS